MSKGAAINTFTDGLVSDLNAITTPNSVLTDVKNGTILTFNGNELVLQNDMGNTDLVDEDTTTGKVQLSDGFTPIGIKEHGGVAYIISTDGTNTEIGSFPSPEVSLAETKTKVLASNITIANGSVINLNKNYTISEKINSGEPFIVVFTTNNQSTITDFIGNRKYYKPKLISIEKGVETDITDTLSLQPKHRTGTSFDTPNNYWFLALNSSETFNLSTYTSNQKYQIYKPRKAGSLAFRFELETLDKVYLKDSRENNFPELDQTTNNLTFNVNIEAGSLIKVNSVVLKYTLTNLLTGVSAAEVIMTAATPAVLNPLYPNISTATIVIPNIDLNSIIDYTITCSNTTYNITFDKFILNNEIDLSKDPINWIVSPFYMAEDVLASDNIYIYNLAVGKYTMIQGIAQRLNSDNIIVPSSENQDAYVLLTYETDPLVIRERYNIIGTYEIGVNNKPTNFKNLLGQSVTVVCNDIVKVSVIPEA